MTIVLTSAGSAHINQRNARISPSNDFEALVLGRGSNAVGVGDTLATLTQRMDILVRLDEGYPKLGETDSRNPGAGADVWTWRFTREALLPFVASNLAITNYSPGALIETAPLLMSSLPDYALGQRYDERLIVWFNAKIGLPATLFTATEQSLEGRVQRVETFSARNRGLSTWPSGSVIDNTTARCRPQPGQHVWTAAHVLGIEGASLDPNVVETFDLTVEKWKAADGDWVKIDSDTLDCHDHVFPTLIRGDQRWQGPAGFNAAHVWSQPAGTKEGTFRLKYEMGLCDGDTRKWSVIVEVA